MLSNDSSVVFITHSLFSPCSKSQVECVDRLNKGDIHIFGNSVSHDFKSLRPSDASMRQ